MNSKQGIADPVRIDHWLLALQKELQVAGEELKIKRKKLKVGEG